MDLDGVDVKLARAQHHLEDLTQQVDHVLASSGYSLLSAIEGTPPAWVYRLSGVPSVVPEWSAIVGDILTNLRAALDHLAWQLVILDGQTPGVETSFPLADTGTTKDGQPRAILKPSGWRRGDPGLRRPDLRAAVERVQPYQFAGTAEAAQAGALWQMGNLCNMDKHRELLLVNLFPDLNQIWWGSRKGERGATAHLNPKTPLKDGDWLLRFDFYGQDPPADFDAHVGPILIVLDEGPPMLRTTAIQTTMKTMLKLVEESIVNWEFRQFFS